MKTPNCAVAAAWRVHGVSPPNANNFGLRRPAAASLSPYGLEHAHKLLSVSDSPPPTRTAEVARAYATRPAKQPQMANILGPCTSHCDTSE